MGIRVHAKGYLQIIRRGQWEWWLVHRKVMYEAYLELCYYPLNGNLPAGFTVEHLDHNKQHNCRENLLMLDKRIHDWISSEYWHRIIKPQQDLKMKEWNKDKEPEWVTNDGL